MFKFLTNNNLNKNDFIDKKELDNIKKMYNSMDKNDEFEVSFYNNRNSLKRISLENFVDIINYMKWVDKKKN